MMNAAQWQERIEESGLGRYREIRDHDRGPGEWCVAGPYGFKMPVPDRMIGRVIANLLCGKTEDVADLAAQWVKANEREMLRRIEDEDQRVMWAAYAMRLAQGNVGKKSA